MNNSGGKFQEQTKQSLICLDFYTTTTTEKQEFQGCVRLHSYAAKGNRIIGWNCIVKGEGAPHSPCATSAHCPAET